jgi:TolB-like protein/class 3 adenylate cyclase/Tfp pilus assembly protein PilF
MADGARSSKTLTLVFTDLADSTALKTERGDQAVGDLISRHRGLVQKLAADSGGRIIDWAGDGCFLTFDAPSAAVLFALRLQQAHGEEPDLPGIRIGMHMGEVTEGPSPAEDGRPRVEGLAVDLAARISGLARPGQVLMSSAVYDSARSRLGATTFGRPVRWQTHGGYALKGFDKALEVGEAGLEGIAPFEAPTASDKVTPVRAAPGASAPAPAARTRTRSLFVAMVLIATLSLAAAYLWIRRSSTDGGAARKPITSLAVLPFKNFSGDREQDYFVDGMTEALISELAKIKSIKVISRTSAMLYRGTEKPLPQVARELGVDGLVEGSVYKGGEDVRITAQLIRGATDEHLWSESYTETLANVLRLQAKVALAISREIQATLSPEDERRLASARPVVPEAHEAFLRGEHLYNQATPDAFEQAARYFREAIKHDPTYAPAYAWLANVYWTPSITGFAKADFVVARALANEALRLDPESADAHTAIAYIAAVTEWEWARSEAEFRRAIALDPSNGWGYFGLSDLLAEVGRFDDGIAAAKAALERDPLSPFNLWQVAYLQFVARHYEVAVKEYEHMLQLAPDFTVALSGAADTYWWAGRREEALRIARDLVTRDASPTSRAYLAYMLALSGRREEGERALAQAVDEGERSYVVPSNVVLALAALGDHDGAFRWIERALDERDYSMLQLKTYPNYDPLRSDPRFQAVLRRMKFPE